MSRARRSRWIAACVACLALLAASGASAAEKARLAFSAFSAHVDIGGGIYTMAADGSERRRVIPSAVEPSWSPDGRLIAYTRVFEDEEGADEGSAIWVAAPDGSGARPLTKAREGWEESSPVWSPDGRRVAFARVRFGKRGLVSTIVSVAAEGGDERKLTELVSGNFGALDSPAWSPDGSTLLVTRRYWFGDDDAEGEPALFKVAVADGRLRLVRRNAADGAWSPAGDRIVYVAERPGCKAGYCREIYVANPDGGNRRRLTTNEGDDGSPDWSPDGQRIAFHSTRNSPNVEQPEIYSIQPDGQCLTWLTNGTAESYEPAWQPGAGPSTDPGGCGATAREPLVEVDLDQVARYRRVPAWWLGMRFGNLLLTGTAVEDGAAYFDYGDCAAYEPADCREGFALVSAPVCLSAVLVGDSGRTVTRHGGALVSAPRSVEEYAPTIYTGPTQVTVEEPERMPAGVVEGLRRFGDDAPPAGGLPRAELPQRFWRGLERIRATVRKYGSAEARRRLRLSRRDLSDRLSLDRALRKLGPFGRLDCTR